MATSYSNRGGSGNRGPIISATINGLVFSGTGTFDLIDGSYVNALFPNGTSLNGSTSWIKFDFSVIGSIVIDEAKWYQLTGETQGTWKWQGSNDNSTWVDIGGEFTLGGTLQIHTTLNGNTTAYAYYRLLGMSGRLAGNGDGAVSEVEFKIDSAPQYAGQGRTGKVDISVVKSTYLVAQNGIVSFVSLNVLVSNLSQRPYIEIII
jgi:hypothetical protein